MRSSQNRYRESLSLLTDGQLLSNVSYFTNPLMRSVVFSYFLSEACDVKIEIKSMADQNLVRDIFLIRGNAGGRVGRNKVLWDGTSASGLKVSQGQYQVRFLTHHRYSNQEKIIDL